MCLNRDTYSFEFIVSVLLDWLPTKAAKYILLDCLTHSWNDSFFKVICANVNVMKLDWDRKTALLFLVPLHSPIFTSCREVANKREWMAEHRQRGLKKCQKLRTKKTGSCGELVVLNMEHAIFLYAPSYSI